MSFDTSITLKNALNADVVFVRLSDDGSSSTYSRRDATIGLPQNLGLSNTMAPVGQTGNDKYLVKFTKAKVHATTGKVEQMTMNFTMSIPRSFLDEDVNDGAAFLKSFLVDANLVKLRRGEV